MIENNADPQKNLLKGYISFIEETSSGKAISSFQSKMCIEFRNFAGTHKGVGHLTGWTVAVADFVIDLLKDVIVTVEHLARGVFETIGIAIKKCSGERCFKSCTWLSAGKHLGYGIKGVPISLLFPVCKGVSFVATLFVSIFIPYCMFSFLDNCKVFADAEYYGPEIFPELYQVEPD